MRLFLAINLPPDARQAIVDATEPLRAAAPDLSWVAEPRLHLTLKFFGEQSEETAGQLTEAIAGVAARHRPLAIEVGGVGAFPNFRRPRVVWLGIEQDARLELLHHDVEVACERLGFELEGRPFRPHLTLARVKRPVSAVVLRALAKTAKNIDHRAELIVQSIDLMESKLSPAGPGYRVVAAAPLRGGR